MSEISYKQEVEMLEELARNLSEGHNNYEEVVIESIDSILPVYYNQIVQEWTEAGMPLPDCDTGDIFRQMTNALWEAYSEFTWNLLSEATNADTARELVQEALGQRKGYANLAQAIIA